MFILKVCCQQKSTIDIMLELKFNIHKIGSNNILTWKKVLSTK